MQIPGAQLVDALSSLPYSDLISFLNNAFCSNQEPFTEPFLRLFIICAYQLDE